MGDQTQRGPGCNSSSSQNDPKYQTCNKWKATIPFLKISDPEELALLCVQRVLPKPAAIISTNKPLVPRGKEKKKRFVYLNVQRRKNQYSSACMVSRAPRFVDSELR